eukprot:5418977-Alexandrium_andersonii.AAC.1
MPGYLRSSLGREVLTIPVVPPHEALHREAVETDGFQERVSESLQSTEWARAYHEHAVVKRSEGLIVHPIALGAAPHRGAQKGIPVQ